MARNGLHEPMSDQLATLQSAVDDVGKDEKGTAIADKGRQILSLARELAGEIAHVTRDTVSTRASDTYRQVRDTAQYDVEVARDLVRSHPLLAVAGIAAISAIVATVVTTAASRRRY